MDKRYAISHLEVREGVGGCIILLVIVWIGGYNLNSDPFSGSTTCVVVNCTESSINIGDKEAYFGLECIIEKKDCSQNCFLDKREMSKETFDGLKLESKNDCKYKEGRTYLGREIKLLIHKQGEDRTIIFLVTYIPLMAYSIRLWYKLEDRREAYSENLDNVLIENKMN